MDLSDSPDEAQFRHNLRTWLEKSLPQLPWPEPADLVEKAPFWRQWQAMLFEAGYAGLTWPREYGGQGLDERMRAIFGGECDLAGAPFNHGYDTWCRGNAFTDFIVADWVVQKQPGYKQKFNIISCYTPMKEEDRGYLLNEIGARKIAANVLSDFQKLMPGMNVDPVEVHIYRRGHPMYMLTPGLYTQVQPLVRHPMDRVFFANTDSEGPESTTDSGILAAQRAVKEVEARLAGRPAPKQKAVAG